MDAEARREKRLPVALRLRMTLPLGEMELYTQEVSRHGFSVRLDDAPPIGEELAATLFLPDDTAVHGLCTCRNRRPSGVVGFSFAPYQADLVFWEIFVDQEESAGSLWRLLARYASTVDDSAGSLRAVMAEGPSGSLQQPVGRTQPGGGASVSMRLNAVGEHGEAYRIIFAKHPSDEALHSDLCRKVPSFVPLAQEVVVRVLRENVMVRLNERSPLRPVRPMTTVRGDIVYVERDGDRCGLVSLCVGEMMLVEVDGQSVFPHFTPHELELIARDTSEWDVAPTDPLAMPDRFPARGRGAATDPLAAAQPCSEAERVVRTALEVARQVQSRSYGDREFRLYPRVWVQVTDRDGHQLSGPGMMDGERVCVLALRGQGAPRVVRLSDATSPQLIDPPERSTQD